MSYFYSNQYTDSSSASPPSSASFSSLATSPNYFQSTTSSGSSSSSYDFNNMNSSSGLRSYDSYNSNPSRASSVSPTLASSRTTYPSMTWKDRFEASRGFDFEDDMEFCPLVCYPAAAIANCAAPNPYAAPDMFGAGGMVGVGVSSASSPLGSPSHQNSNPFFASSSPDSPPVSNNGGLFTPNNNYNTITYYPNTSNNHHQASYSSPSRQMSLHKVRKGIQIVDPSTGLKVGSHSHAPAGMAKPTRV